MAIKDLLVAYDGNENAKRAVQFAAQMAEKYGATITYAPNFAYDMVTKRVKEKDLAKLDLSRLRVAGCGAEPIRAQTRISIGNGPAWPSRVPSC